MELRNKRKKNVNSDYGSTIKVMEAPVLEGYTFYYWEEPRYNPGDEYVVTEDHTLTAHWTKAVEKEYIITFNPNGGSVSINTATTSGGRLNSLPTPSRSGYTFTGWYTARSYGLKISTDTVFTEDTTLYAHWSHTNSPTTGDDSPYRTDD